jgi:ParB family chromosome partitioning protein
MSDTQTEKTAETPVTQTAPVEKKPARIEEPKASETHTHLPLNQLVLTGNIRHETPDVQGLAATIKDVGVLQPIGVRVHRDTDGNVVANKYDVVYGFRRAFAARDAGLKEIPVYFVDADDARRHMMAMIENLQRADMNPMEKGLGMQKMMIDANLTQKDVAHKLGVTEGFVSQHLALLRLPPKVKTAVSNGKIDLSQARELNRLHDHEEKMLELLPDVTKLSTSELKTKVDIFLEKEKTKAEKTEHKTAAKKKTTDDDGDEDASAQRKEKKSLAEQYEEAELEPLGKNALRENLQAFALKMERAKTEEARNKYKYILKGMEIAAGIGNE